jgi:uncharacterized protein YggE
MNARRSPRIAASVGVLAALIFGLSLLMSPFVAAQSTPEPGEEPIRTITVNGTGVVKVDPDTASINLGVISNNESLEVAQQEVSEALEATTQTLTDLGILPEDIATSSYNIYPIAEYDRDGNYVGIERYEVSSGLTVTVRDIDSVGTVLDSAVQAGVNNIWSISFYVDDPAEAAAQARRSAVEDARGKADELATAAGMVVVNVVTINETSAPDPASLNYDLGRGGAEADMAMEQAASVPVSPGQTEIRVEVSIVFEIEAAAG